jgi:phage repressor protein C with HTH and peptisase S24 domain
METVSAALLPWQRVRVSGPSMVPTLYDGDVVVVRHTIRVRSGDLVLARFRDVPDRLVVKRAVAPDGTGWHVRSDNEAAGGDSRTHGPADVVGRIMWRWSARAGRRARWLPARV